MQQLVIWDGWDWPLATLHALGVIGQCSAVQCSAVQWQLLGVNLEAIRAGGQFLSLDIFSSVAEYISIK